MARHQQCFEDTERPPSQIYAGLYPGVLLMKQVEIRFSRR